MEDKKKRIRRTNVDIDRDIMAATKALVEEIGYANITITGVMQKAKIEPNVFYNRFKDIDLLINSYARQYDTWFVDKCASPTIEHTIQEQFSKLFSDLTNALFDDKGMQQLLIWEIAGNSNTATQMSQERDKNSSDLAIYYKSMFKVKDIDLAVFTSLIISGIYYLILHKDISQFCGEDFTGEQGKQKILKCVQSVVDKVCVFEGQSLIPQVLDVARKLKCKGVDAQTIIDCTNISVEELAKL